MNDASNSTIDKVTPAAAPAATEQATNLSQHVFADPREFLKTIQDNFKEMSHGHDYISLDDLKSDMTTGSTDKIRAAATIAGQHFSDLDRISEPDRDNSGIAKDDLDFATDMNDHNISGEAIQKGVFDAAASVSALFAGGVALLLGQDSLAGVGLFGASGGVVLPAITIGAGVACVGVGVFGAYETATAYSQMNQESNEDAAKFKSWM